MCSLGPYNTLDGAGMESLTTAGMEHPGIFENIVVCLTSPEANDFHGPQPGQKCHKTPELTKEQENGEGMSLPSNASRG